MKNTTILLIFLLAVVGLIVGVYYTEDISSDNFKEKSSLEVNEKTEGIITVTLEKEKKENDDLSKYFT